MCTLRYARRISVMERAADALRELGCLFAPLRTADALADFMDLEAALPQQMPNRDEEMASRLKQRGNALSGGAFAMKLLRERLHGLVAPRFARLREILVARNPATDDDIILVSPATSCAACGSNNLQLGKDGRLTTRHLSPKIYSACGMRNGELHAKICGDCGAHHGLNFATLGPIPHGHCRLIRDSIAAPYYQGPDGQMVFSVPDVLLRMKAQAVHSHTAFETFASEYFSLTGTHLPRYPFQSAYLTFALMLMLDEFGLQEHACETPMALSRYTMTQGQSNLDRTLQTYAALLSPKFTKYYAGEHKLRCRLPNGHKDCIWIVDGHMKVKRTVCDNDAAREVDLGEIGINIMPCDRTPMRGQRFCYTCNEAAAYGPALCEPCKPCEPCEPTAPDALDAPDAPKAPDAPDAPRAPQVPPVPNTPPELTAPAAPAAPSLKPAPEPEPSARAMALAEPSDSAMNVEAAVEAIEQEELAEYAPDERTPLDAQAQAMYLVEKLVDKRAVLQRNAAQTNRTKRVKECMRLKHYEYQVKFVGYDDLYWTCQCDINKAALEAGVEAAPGSQVEAARKASEQKRAEARERKKDTEEWMQKHTEASAISDTTASGPTTSASEGPPSSNTRHAGVRAAALQNTSTGDFENSNQGMSDVGCNNLKELQYAGEIRRTTAGVLALVSSCGLFLAVDEIVANESLRCVHAFFYAIMYLHHVAPPKVIAYDDACHLLRFWQLREAKSTFVSWVLNSLELVVDRFHFRNHVGKFCKQWVDPSKCEALSDDSQTEAAEQSFSWLARSKHMFRGMSKGRFQFMLLHLLHERNQYLMQVPIKRSMRRKSATSLTNV